MKTLRGQLLVMGIWSLVLVRAASAEDAWLLTTADFNSQRVSLRSIDDSGVSISVESEPPRTIAFDRFLMLARASKPAATAAKFVVILGNGDRAVGQPSAIQGENLVCSSPALGQLVLPMRSVTAILRIGQELPGSATPPTEDVVTLLNGDSVRGIVTRIAGTAIIVQQAGGEEASVPLDSAARITFASTTSSRPALQRGFRVGLSDGSAITSPRLAMADESVRLTMGDGSIKPVSIGLITSIEQVNGPVVWLSTLNPVESAQKPFLELAWPARMDRSADGGPIRFGDRVYSRGIGVHSYSQLTFAVDPAAMVFRAGYAIAGDWPYADVTVRIKLDGKVVHEKADFRAGVLAEPVKIDVAGGKQIVLEVDYGQNYDVQDRFNWIEPAFLKFRP